MFILREDQQDLTDRLDGALLDGRRPCAVAPTGSGKTVILAEEARLALARGERVVAMAYREEIVGQIIRSLRFHLGRHVKIEPILSGSRSRYQSPVTVGMVPTLNRRLSQLGALEGATLLADEAHHMGSNTWDAVVKAINPRRFAGLTATPIRPNGKGLGDVTDFTELLIGPRPADLMAAGHLCRFRIFASPHKIDSKGLRKRAGEFITAEIEKKVIEINGDIVPDWMAFNPSGARTICVGVSVEHAHELAKLFRAAGVPAEAVDGATPKGERAAIFARFRAGATVVLCACAVIDEGLDVPEATVLQLTRPMASLRLWLQLLGRVLRPSEGKGEALIIDHTDNWSRLPPPDADIDWQLNKEQQEVKDPRRMVIDPVTLEVTAGDPIPVEITTNGRKLVEITPEMMAGSDPRHVRKVMNERCLADVGRVMAGCMSADKLHPWLKRLPVLDDAAIRALGSTLKMPPGWADTQLMLNDLQSNNHRLAVTKQLRKAWT